jgi:HTH-type transcriptional regulator/antitoxin HipB
MTQLARTSPQLGNAIRRARRSLGLSQATLAEKTGLRQATISQIETGHPGTKIETLLAVLAALDLQLQVAARSQHSLQDLEDIL